MKRSTETLLLAAHGSSRPGDDNPVIAIAERLKALEAFADVRCGFLKQEPLLADVLLEIQTPDLIVVPMLSGNGYITDTLIPEALSPLNNDHNVRLCPPLGCHPDIAQLMAARALKVIAEHNLEDQHVSILVAAHGNNNNPDNAGQTQSLARQIEELTGGVQTNSAFIEEQPLISSWPSITPAENLIVLPFLIGGGMHGTYDVPVMLGFGGNEQVCNNLATDTGPLHAHDRTIWCCRALGFEPAMSDLILDLTSET